MKDVLEDLQNRGNLLGEQLYDIGGRMNDALKERPSSAESECDSLGSKAASLKQVANFSKVSECFEVGGVSTCNVPC